MLMGGQYADGIAPERMELRQYRRFDTPEMLVCVERGARSNGADGLSPDGSQVDRLLADLGRCGIDAIPAEPGDSRSRAVLTRTNLEAYQVWKRCVANGIDADLWRGAQGAYWPGWIARLFLGFMQETISVNLVRERWASHVAPYVPLTADEAIDFLTNEGTCDGDTVDLRELNRVVSNGAPSSIRGAHKAALIVSTIHRSKGLEFDEVYLYEPRKNTVGDPPRSA